MSLQFSLIRLLHAGFPLSREGEEEGVNQRRTN